MITKILNRAQAKGFKKQPVDKRDYRYSGSSSYASVDLRIQGWKVRNQWLSNACTGFATAALLEHLLRKNFDYEEDLSPMMNWYAARVYEGTESKNVGVWLRDVLKSVYDVGVVPYKTYPFSFPYTKKPVLYAYSVGEVMKYFLSHTAYYLMSPDDVIASLHEGSPVVCGLMLNNSWFGNKDGLVDEEKHNNSSHAMLVVGYDEEKQAFVLRNSWGSRWGDRGYAYVPKNYFLSNAHDCWTIRVKDK